MKPYSQFKKEILKNRKVQTAYDALGPEFEVAASLIKRRLEKALPSWNWQNALEPNNRQSHGWSRERIIPAWIF